jgi:hypothetical protein
MTKAQAPVVTCLACTHYGYRKDAFAESFAAAGVRATVINPNESAVDDLFGTDSESRAAGASHEVEVKFVTRYPIPPATVEALTFFLKEISPRTVMAMQNFEHIPELF